MNIEEIWKMIKSHKKAFIICILVLVVIIPGLIYLLLWTPIPTNNSDDNGWLSFWGSFLGGMFGGTGTLIAVVATTLQAKNQQEESLNETRRIQDENNQYMRKKDYLEDVKRNRPMLVLNEENLGSNYALENRLNIGKVDIKRVSLHEMQNVGLGLAKDISVNIELIDGNISQSIYANILTKEKIIKNYSYDHSNYFNENIEGKIKKIIIKYNDIFDNFYETIYETQEYRMLGTHYLKIGKIDFKQHIK